METFVLEILDSSALSDGKISWTALMFEVTRHGSAVGQESPATLHVVLYFSIGNMNQHTHTCGLVYIISFFQGVLFFHVPPMCHKDFFFWCPLPFATVEPLGVCEPNGRRPCWYARGIYHWQRPCGAPSPELVRLVAKDRPWKIEMT